MVEANGADLTIKDHKTYLDPLDIANQRNLVEIGEIIMEKMIEMKEAAKPAAKRIKFELEDCVVCKRIRNEIFVFTQCGHAKTCETCSMKIVNRGSTCPICRKFVTSYLKAYF